MSVAFDNGATSATSTNTVSSSATVAVGSLTNPCAVVIVAWEASATKTVSTIRLDNTTTAFTRFNGVTATMDGSPCGVDMWYLTGASLTNASHTFDVRYSAALTAKFEAVIVYQGVDQATPLASFTSSSTTTSPVAITPSGGTANDALVAAMMNVDGVGTQTPAVGANTTIVDAVRKETNFDGAVFIAGRAAGNAATIGFSWSTIVAEETIGAVVKSAGGAATVNRIFFPAQTSAMGVGGVLGGNRISRSNLCPQ